MVRIELRTLISKRPDWALFFALLVVDLVALACTPVLTGHDLPQHLAYARLLGDWDARALPSDYEPPFGDDPYFLTYKVLVAFARVMPLLRALTVLYALYAVTTAFAFAFLARATSEHARGEVCMPIAFGPLVVWNPVTCMGFLPFMLGMPLALFGAGAALRFGREARPRFLVMVALVAGGLASLHVALLAMWLVVLACLFVARPTVRAAAPLASTLVPIGAVLAWFARHGAPGASFTWAGYAENVRAYGLVDGTVGTFILSWSSPAERVKLALATALGPFPRAVKAALGVLVLAFAAVLVASARGPAARSVSRRTVAVASLAFMVLSICAPTAIQRPDDMCLIDLRLYTLVFMLALAAFPTAWLLSKPARFALALMSFGFALAWGWSLVGAGREALPAVALVQRLGPNDRLLALSFRDRSDYLDEDNANLHYLPVHHTAASGGLTTIFWGRFSRHLPIGWAPSREPPHPATWAPEAWTRDQVSAATHVLVSLPRADDPEEKRAGAARLFALEGQSLERVACEGDFCLFEVRVPH